MEQDVLSFTQIKIDQDLLSEVWSMDPRTLEQVDGSKLSSYALALAQYLIYFTYQRNLTKAEQHRLSKYIDRRVSLIMSESSKKFKTKADAIEYYISTEEDLMAAQTKLEVVQHELFQVEGIDKVLGDLIATIKRELTRRENELFQIRMERRK